MSAICIIPAKGTSKRIPGKNIKDFLGKPIIAYSIEIALESRLFDRVIVSSESQEVLAIAKSYGAHPWVRRAELSEVEGHADCGTQEVVRDALIGNPRVDYACCLYPCTPLLMAQDLALAYLRIRQGNEMFIRASQWSKEGKESDAGQFYFGPSFAFLARWKMELLTDRLPTFNDAFDINTPEDWAAAEAKYKELHP